MKDVVGFLGCGPLVDTCNLTATSMCPKESFTMQESVGSELKKVLSSSWNSQTHNPQPCLYILLHFTDALHQFPSVTNESSALRLKMTLLIWKNTNLCGFLPPGPSV